MLARDIMTTGVITVTPDHTMQELARVLTDAGISGAPVLTEGALAGIVSEADVISKRGASVGEVMHRSVITVSEDTPVEEVCSIMARNNINRVPVMSGPEVRGIITRTDVVRAIAHGSLEASTVQPDVPAGAAAQAG